ncbi:MAG: hypothetical protein AAGN82_09450 [Myxococcota bacterium]
MHVILCPVSRYQPFYCEENVWWRVRETEGRCWALFITNPQRRVLLWQQRLAPPDAPIRWDYHVVMVGAAPRGLVVYDLDTRLPLGIAVDAYLDGTFPYGEESGLPGPYAPGFRLVSREAMLATFATDRRHMRRDDGSYLHPPPPWPPIIARDTEQRFTLDRYLDLEDDIAGEVSTLSDLRIRLSRL